jgi:hypothetical protein
VPLSRREQASATLPIENFYDLAGAFGNCRHEGGVEFRSGKKPEVLLQLLLKHFSKPGDLVLDSFAGSGTTGAVAHKMGRRWIMVELGEHARTHIVPRLKKVIDGQDPSGVTEATGWQGGGGFVFYTLAPSLIEEDQFGQKIISKKYNAAMLAEAMCKHMGFTYAPSSDPTLYWQQGYSSERDFIYVTTQALTHDGMKALSLAVGPDRTLLVCCKAFRARLSDFPNLTVKKIPQAVLDNCEWGRDDYSLNIVAAPEADPDDTGNSGNGGNGEAAARPRGRRRRAQEDGAEIHAVTQKKAPLKMDGTVRASKRKAAVSPAPGPVKPPEKTKSKSSPAVVPSKPASKPKQAKAKAAKPKVPTAAIARAKPRTRRGADNRQGRLL